MQMHSSAWRAASAADRRSAKPFHQIVRLGCLRRYATRLQRLRVFAAHLAKRLQAARPNYVGRAFHTLRAALVSHRYVTAHGPMPCAAWCRSPAASVPVAQHSTRSAVYAIRHPSAQMRCDVRTSCKCTSLQACVILLRTCLEGGRTKKGSSVSTTAPAAMAALVKTPRPPP